MRRYFELLTGVQTGADNTNLVQAHLQIAGMKGEDIVDDSVWIVKTHSPWCMPYAPIFYAQKQIVVLRNPMDVINSWLELITMTCHSAKAPFKYNETYPKFWDFWVKDCTYRIKTWYKKIINDAK